LKKLGINIFFQLIIFLLVNSSKTIVQDIIYYLLFFFSPVLLFYFIITDKQFEDNYFERFMLILSYSFITEIIKFIILGWLMFYFQFGNEIWILLIFFCNFMTVQLNLNKNFDCLVFGLFLKGSLLNKKSLIFLLTIVIRIFYYFIFPPFNMFDVSTSYYPAILSMIEQNDLIANYKINGPNVIWAPPGISFVYANFLILFGEKSYEFCVKFAVLLSCFSFPIIFSFFSKIYQNSSSEVIILSFLVSSSVIGLTFGNDLYTDWISFLIYLIFTTLLIDNFNSTRLQGQNNFKFYLILGIILISYGVRKTLLVLEISQIILMVIIYRKTKFKSIFQIFIVTGLSLLFTIFQLPVIYSRNSNINTEVDHYTAISYSVQNIQNNLINNSRYYILNSYRFFSFPPNILGISLVNDILSLIIFLQFFLIPLVMPLLMKSYQKKSSADYNEGKFDLINLYVISLSPLFIIHLIFYASDWRYFIPLIPALYYFSIQIFTKLVNLKNVVKIKYIRIMYALILITIMLVSIFLQIKYENPRVEPFRRCVTDIKDQVNYSSVNSIQYSNQPASVYYHTEIKGYKIDYLAQLNNLSMTMVNSNRINSNIIIILDNYLGDPNVYHYLLEILKIDNEYMLFSHYTRGEKICQTFISI